MGTGNLDGLFNWGTDNIKSFCLLCGESCNTGTELCNTCYLKFYALQRLETIKKLINPDSKVHCFTCYSHINACKCPKKTKLDELKA